MQSFYSERLHMKEFLQTNQLVESVVILCIRDCHPSHLNKLHIHQVLWHRIFPQIKF